MIGRDWTVGMEVVCIVEGEQRKWWAHNDAARDVEPPQPNKIYRISDIELDEDDGRIYIGLAEYAPDVGFDARGFRPVEKRRTDISIFTAMLTGAKEREPV